MSLSMTLAVFGEVGLSLFLAGGIRVGMYGSFQRYRHDWYMIHINMALRCSPMYWIDRRSVSSY